MHQIIVVHLFLTVFISSFVLVKCGLLPPSCYSCASFLYKGWGRKTCDGTSHDCGQCLEGYSAGVGSESACQPLSVINVNESKIAFVPLGATVNLECIFNMNIAGCVLERRGFEVEISGRYRYSQESHQGDGIKDCSVSITGFKEIDVGDFKCSSAATSNTNSVPNINPYLAMTQENMVTVDHNVDLFLPVGGSVILKCYFEQKVDCLWLRRGNIVEVGGHYKYLTSNNNGKNTKECSIQIDDVTDIDFGRWDCKSRGHGSTYATLKSAVWLTKASPKPLNAAVTQSHLTSQSANAVDLNENSRSGPSTLLIASVAVLITLSIIVIGIIIIFCKTRSQSIGQYIADDGRGT